MYNFFIYLNHNNYAIGFLYINAKYFKKALILFKEKLAFVENKELYYFLSELGNKNNKQTIDNKEKLIEYIDNKIVDIERFI